MIPGTRPARRRRRTAREPCSVRSATSSFVVSLLAMTGGHCSEGAPETRPARQGLPAGPPRGYSDARDTRSGAGAAVRGPPPGGPVAGLRPLLHVHEVGAGRPVGAARRGGGRRRWRRQRPPQGPAQAARPWWRPAAGRRAVARALPRRGQARRTPSLAPATPRAPAAAHAAAHPVADPVAPAARPVRFGT